MTASQAVPHKSWMVRCSPHTLLLWDFSRNNNPNFMPPLVSNTNFMTTRELQIILFGKLNMDLWIGTLQLQPPYYYSTLACESYCLFRSNYKSWNDLKHISPPLGCARHLFLKPLQPVTEIAYTPNRTKTNHH